MRIIGARMAPVEDAQDEPRAIITIEFEEYEVQELANQERERIERGLSVGDARVALKRFSALRLALNQAREAKRS